MKKPLYLFIVVFILSTIFSNALLAQAPANDAPCSATNLTSGTPVAATVWNATSSGVLPTSAIGNPDDDVWFRITATASGVATITLSSIGTELANSGAIVQIFSGACGSLTSTKFQNGAIGPLIVNGLANGTNYYVRVFAYATGALPGTSAESAFTITFSNAALVPTNDDCSGAILIPVSTGRLNQTGWFAGATTSVGSGAPAPGFGGNTNFDIWYKFVATSTSAFVTTDTSVFGSSGNPPATLRMQVLAGSCGSFTSKGESNAPYNGVTVNSLTVGTTYYIRLFLSTTTPVTAASGTKYTDVAVIGATQGNVADSTTTLFYMDTVARNLGFPWEITYGPDDSLWVTEAKGYRVLRMNPNRTGASETTPLQQVLKIPLGGTGNPGPTFTRADNIIWPQGGMEGLAVHPELATDPTKRFVYIAYVYGLQGTCQGSGPTTTNPCIYRSKIIRCRFYFAADAGNPTSIPKRDTLTILDTVISNLPGSNDHNSGRLVFGPVKEGGQYKLYYTIGDMGAGQFNNTSRTNNAQNKDTCEGKILRLNSEPDGDASFGVTHDYNIWRQWIPNDNPFTHSVNGLRTPIYSYGHRNAQGLAWGQINGTWRLYESEHGDKTGDEVNIIEMGMNYGWPKVTGMSDNNYNTYDNLNDGLTLNDILANATVTDEGTFYENQSDVKRPIFDMFNWTAGAIQGTASNIYTWPTIGTSSIGFYNGSIPGWKNSLLVASLKYGMFRIKLNANGDFVDSTSSANVVDTFPLFHGWRVRDMAIDPHPNSGKIWVVLDSTGSTSGPTGGFGGATITAKSGGKVLMLTYKGSLTLPVHYISFTGKLLTDKTIRLEWKADIEPDHSHFEVEKSADGFNFTTIGIVTSLRSPYSFIDRTPFTGNNYYRIKGVDNKGKFEYSKTINIVYDPTAFIMTLYPNPIRESLNMKLALPKPDNIRVQVYDMQGHVVYNQSKFIPTAVGEIKIDTRSWSSQLYTVKLIGSNNQVLATQKVIKQ